MIQEDKPHPQSRRPDLPLIGKNVEVANGTKYLIKSGTKAHAFALTSPEAMKADKEGRELQGHIDRIRRGG